MTRVEQLLTQVEAQCRAAREALADEHEAGVRTAVTFLDSDAAELMKLVTGW